MAKELKFDKDAKESLLAGINKLNGAVKVTMGGRGRSVLISNGSGTPIITQDGVTVAKNLTLNDRFENIGSEVVKSVADKTAMLAGDGTTTATVLASEIINRGFKLIDEDEKCPIMLNEGIKLALEDINKLLKSLANPIETMEDVYNIALISSKGDKEIAKLISDAMEQVGADGVISLEDSKNDETTLQVAQGLTIQRGLLSPHFINNKKKKTCEYEGATVLLVDSVIGNVKELEPIFNLSNKSGVPIVIIAHDFSEIVADVILQNVNKGAVNIVPIKAPSFGDNRTQQMFDIGASTTATLFGDLKPLSAFTEKDLGFCEKVVVSAKETVFIEGGKVEEVYTTYVENLHAQLKNAETGIAKEQLEYRIANINGGVAKIVVGGNSEEEKNERKDRIDDALNATKSATQEGYVAGAGVTLYNIGMTMDMPDIADNDTNMGYILLMQSILKPFRQILENAGVKNIDEIGKDAEAYPMGMNVRSKKIVNLIEDGVIDPVKVTRVALKNAVSIASLLLTTECVMVDTSEFIAH